MTEEITVSFGITFHPPMPAEFRNLEESKNG